MEGIAKQEEPYTGKAGFLDQDAIPNAFSRINDDSKALY